MITKHCKKETKTHKKSYRKICRKKSRRKNRRKSRRKSRMYSPTRSIYCPTALRNKRGKKKTKKSYFNIKAHDNYPKGLQTKALKSYNDWLASVQRG